LSVKAKYPHQLSGGQLRRVAMARLMAVSPQVMILDEPTAGLDLSIQATILNLLIEVKRAFGLTNIFISHDMAVVRLVCDRVAVMYLGKIVEEAPASAIFGSARHPYTRALLAAMPGLGPRSAAPAIAGDPPGAGGDDFGCSFRARCLHAVGVCGERPPLLESISDNARLACHRWRELAPA
jgi:oligopeptide/dipeptide ABC transporter ATP-binding protein